MKKQTGFTFIEIMIAIGLVALLSTIAFSFYRDEVTTTEDAVLVEQLDEASRQLTVYTSTHEPIERCEDAASKVKLPDFDSNAVNLRLDFAPIDETDPALGQRAVAVVSTDPDSNMDVARDIHTSLGNKVAPGAVLTDSLISFSVYLSPAGDPFCNSISGAVATNSQLPPAPAPGPAAPLCKSNEIVSSANGACIKACNAGFHSAGGKCAWGDCPAGQTLDGSGYCIAASQPPPAPAPGPAAPLCKSNEIVSSANGACIKACNAGFHPDGGKCVMGDCPAGQTLDGSGYCIAAAPPPPPPPPPPPAPDPAAKLAGTTTDPAANLAGTTTDPAAKSAGTTTDPAAKLTGPAPAATLQTPASSNPPPPPPPPPPAPDPAANLAGKTTDPAANSAGPAPDPNPPATVQKVARGAATTITEFPTKDNHPCKEGDVFIPGKGQTLGQYPMTGSCQEDSPNRPNKDPYAGVQCEVCGDVPPFLCERRHTTTTCTWPNNICMNHIINQDSGARTVDRTCTNRETAHREWYLGSSDNDRCQQFRQEEIYTLGFECRYACVHDNCNTPVSPLVNGKGVMW